MRDILLNTVPLEEAEQGVWQAICPLPPLEPSVPDLPPELLPTSLRPYLSDAAERSQIPLSYVAIPALVGMGSIVGRTVGIFPKANDSWLVVPNLWGVLIGRPGVMKSPAIKEALKPIHRLTAEAIDLFSTDAAERTADIQIAKAEVAAAQEAAKKAAKNGDKTAATAAKADLITANRLLEQTEGSVAKRYIINDATVEKIGELLNQNPRGLLLERDELYGFLRGLEKSGREGDREFYLEAWNGAGRFTYDRIGRGTIHVEALCLSIIGTMQPGRFRAYIAGALKGGTGDDGLLQRFQLAVWPDVSSDWKNVDQAPDNVALEQAYETFRYLDTLDLPSVGSVGAINDIPGLHFAPDAQELFDEWRYELETRLRSPEMEGTPAFESHLAKYRSLMPSIALLLHLVDQSESPGVSLDAAQRASAWCDFLEQHARKIYAAEINADLAAAHRLLEKIKAGAIEEDATPRHIYLKNWSGLSSPEDVWDALSILERHHVLRVVKQDTGGRPSDIIRISPLIIEGKG